MLVTELTPPDTIRTFGLIGGLLYFVLLALPLFRLPRSRMLWWAWLLFLASAVTNPYVFSPIGAVMVATVATATYEKRPQAA